MKLSDLRNLCKIKIPSLKATGLSDSDLNLIINEGVEQFNILAKVYRGYTNFNLVLGQQTYSLAVIAPTFQEIVTAGLWVSTTGQATDLKRVIPRTEEWLNKRLPTWRSASATALPQYYYQSGDNLVIYPAINANITNGGRIHHVTLPTTMGSDDSYPFSGTTRELTVFRPADLAIVEYVRWQLAPSLNKETGEDMTYGRFLQFVNRAKSQIRAKPDAMNYYDTAMSVST